MAQATPRKGTKNTENIKQPHQGQDGLQRTPARDGREILSVKKKAEPIKKPIFPKIIFTDTNTSGTTTIKQKQIENRNATQITQTN